MFLIATLFISIAIGFSNTDPPDKDKSILNEFSIEKVNFDNSASFDVTIIPYITVGYEYNNRNYSFCYYKEPRQEEAINNDSFYRRARDSL